MDKIISHSVKLDFGRYISVALEYKGARAEFVLKPALHAPGVFILSNDRVQWNITPTSYAPREGWAGFYKYLNYKPSAIVKAIEKMATDTASLDLMISTRLFEVWSTETKSDKLSVSLMLCERGGSVIGNLEKLKIVYSNGFRVLSSLDYVLSNAEVSGTKRVNAMSYQVPAVVSI